MFSGTFFLKMQKIKLWFKKNILLLKHELKSAIFIYILVNSLMRQDHKSNLNNKKKMKYMHIRSILLQLPLAPF